MIASSSRREHPHAIMNLKDEQHLPMEINDLLSILGTLNDLLPETFIEIKEGQCVANSIIPVSQKLTPWRMIFSSLGQIGAR